MTRTVQINSPSKGLAFARIAIASALAKGEDDFGYIAKARYGEDSLPHRIAEGGGLAQLIHVKAEVAAGATVAGNWANILTDAESAAAEFFELVRDRSLIGRIAGLRRMPLRTRVISMSSGFSAAWVGEGKAVPVSSAVFDVTTLPALKVGALSVATTEMLESSDPAAERIIRDDMIAALVSAIDASFIDPTNNGVSGVEPASVTNGAPSVAATGNGLDDLRLLIDAFPGDLQQAILIGSAESFAAMHDPLVLPGLGVRGGSAIGIPAFPLAVAGSTLALIDPTGIAYGAGTTDIRTSREASIEMLDTSLAGDSINVVPPTAASTVSLWQTNSAAIICEQAVAWEAARPSAAILEGVDQS